MMLELLKNLQKQMRQKKLRLKDLLVRLLVVKILLIDSKVEELTLIFIKSINYKKDFKKQQLKKKLILYDPT